MKYKYIHLKKLSILIPAFNEEKTIVIVLGFLKDLVLQFPLEKEVVIVNDASTDNTQELIEAFIKDNPYFSILLYNQEVQSGKRCCFT